jgi:hypothetical protein
MNRIILSLLTASCLLTSGLPVNATSWMGDPLDEPVGVLGSGPAGTYAARKLKDAGYRNITVLEGSNHTGGKCFSYPAEDGREYDLGAVQTAIDYDIVNGLCTRFGLMQIDSAPNIFVDSSGQSHTSLPSQYSYPRRMLAFAAYIASGLWNSERTAGYAHIGSNPVLSQDVDSFLSTYTLEPMKEFLNVGLRIYGYGDLSKILVAHSFNYISPRLVTAMVVEQIPVVRNFLSRPAIMSIKEGYQALIQRMAADMDVQFGKQVQSISKTSRGLRVQCSDSSQFEFSRIVVASPPRSIDFGNVLGIDPTSIFNKVQYNAYGTTLFRTPSDVVNGDHLMVDFQGKQPAGILEKFPDQKLYMNYSYVPSGDPVDAIQPLKNFVQQQFHSDIEVVAQNFTPYYPHTSISDAPGYYAAMEGLQGAGGVYFTGSHLSFENVNEAMRHAGEIVDKYFLHVPLQKTLTQNIYDSTLGKLFPKRD